MADPARTRISFALEAASYDEMVKQIEGIDHFLQLYSSINLQVKNRELTKAQGLVALERAGRFAQQIIDELQAGWVED